LGALVRSAVATFGPTAEDVGVGLSDAIPSDPVEVLGDADRMAQVLRNLLSNALRHTPSSGQVTVAVKADDAQVTLEVADTGSGIAPEDLPHVFDRFYRGEKSRSRRGGGAGLGLAITRQLVLAHNGDIQVESELDKGTTFTVTLPR
jgi:two-component system, OmpR family, sensor histidine kinase BaeS